MELLSNSMATYAHITGVYHHIWFEHVSLSGLNFYQVFLYLCFTMKFEFLLFTFQCAPFSTNGINAPRFIPLS